MTLVLSFFQFFWVIAKYEFLELQKPLQPMVISRKWGQSSKENVLHVLQKKKSTIHNIREDYVFIVCDPNINFRCCFSEVSNFILFLNFGCLSQCRHQYKRPQNLRRENIFLGVFENNEKQANISQSGRYQFVFCI